MLKLSSAVCVLILFSCISSQQYDEMTHDEIISESQLCGESNFNEGTCMQKPNCVFLHWHLKNLGEKLRLCLSYSEIMKYFVKDSAEYLKKAGLKNHKTITKSNFCDVMDDNDAFLDQKGEMHRCMMSTV